jgi:hypothetical protein
MTPLERVERELAEVKAELTASNSGGRQVDLCLAPRQGLGQVLQFVAC